MVNPTNEELMDDITFQAKSLLKKLTKFVSQVEKDSEYFSPSDALETYIEITGVVGEMDPMAMLQNINQLMAFRDANENGHGGINQKM